VVGLGASGRAAVKLALARGADVVALDSNPSCLPLEVRLLQFHFFFGCPTTGEAKQDC
jgi:D-arabinose 1-dehydrogenase-like Zn-dependent alcohol dehydrogenase